MISKSTRPMWNDYDEKPEKKFREMEELVAIRAKAKRLADCSLPEGIRLVTPHPRQFWIENQMVWGFCLAWGQVDRLGNRGKDEFYHVERYDQRIPDEVQMGWALEAFSTDLGAQKLTLRMRAA